MWNQKPKKTLFNAYLSKFVKRLNEELTLKTQMKFRLLFLFFFMGSALIISWSELSFMSILEKRFPQGVISLYSGAVPQF